MNRTLKSVWRWSIAAITVIASAFASAQADDGFVIKGNAKGIPDQQITLYTWMLGETPDLSVTAQVVDGKFELKGKVDNPPALMRIKFESPDFVLGDVIVLDNSHISVSLVATDTPPRRGNVSIDKFQGSASHDTYAQLDADIDRLFYSKLSELRIAYQSPALQKPRDQWSEDDHKKADEIQTQSKQTFDQMYRYLKQMASDNPNQLNGLLALYKLIFGHGPASFENDLEREMLFAGLSERLRTSQFGVRYNEYATEQAIKNLERERLAAEVGIGKPFKDFTQNDVDGNPVKVSDILKPGRYVFLDFWASWCRPCRAENPNVLKAYKKYHDKGFDVLAVSLDTDKDDWLDAIEEDGMPWIHVSDLKGWDNAASTSYGVKGIPMNFLLDENGIIVASGLREQALHDKLEELLGD